MLSLGNIEVPPPYTEETETSNDDSPHPFTQWEKCFTQRKGDQIQVTLWRRLKEDGKTAEFALIKGDLTPNNEGDEDVYISCKGQQRKHRLFWLPFQITRSIEKTHSHFQYAIEHWLRHRKRDSSLTCELNVGTCRDRCSFMTFHDFWCACGMSRGRRPVTKREELAKICMCPRKDHESTKFA